MATSAKKKRTASTVTKPATQATSNAHLHDTKANIAWSAQPGIIPNSPFIGFKKRPEYRFEEDVLSGAARINLLVDGNNDGVIDPMEYALGWIGMTGGGDVGLRERDMAMEHVRLQNRTRARPLASSVVKVTKSESSLAPLPKAAKRQSQKRL
jgi:hypothetical protein